MRFLGTFWLWAAPDTYSCCVNKETSQNLLHPGSSVGLKACASQAGLLQWRVVFVWSCQDPSVFVYMQQTSWFLVRERPFPVGSGSLFSLQSLISLLLSTPYRVCIVPGLIWKWCCSHVCKVLYQVSALLGRHRPTQQSLLPPMGVTPSGNSSTLAFVLITRALVRKVYIVDLNIYINISPRALFSWVRGQNSWK